MHLLGAVTHVTGLVTGQDKVAKTGKANEITHFRPLPRDDAVITAAGCRPSASMPAG